MENELSEVWSSFWADGSEESRNRLLLQYSPIVKYVAARAGDGSTDAVQKGLERLSAAVESFQPQNGERFESYAIEAVSEVFVDPTSWDDGWS